MNYLPRILLVSLTLSTATPSFSSNITFDSKTIAYAGAAAVAVGGISYAVYKKYTSPSNEELFEAIMYNDVAAIKNLLEKGANANTTYIDYTGSKQPALAIVAALGNTAIAQELIAHGAQVNARTTFGKGNPAIIFAARQGHVDMVELLLAHGANIESTGYDDATPLIDAAFYGRTQVVTFLLNHGANINAQDEKGKTALIYAVERSGCFFENSYIIKALLEHGADINIKDKSGKTALEYAQQNGFTDIVDILKTQDATK